MFFRLNMSWTDCFILGHQLFEFKAYNHSRMWLKESLRRLKEGSHFNFFSYDLLSRVTKNLKNLKEIEVATGFEDIFWPKRNSPTFYSNSSDSCHQNIEQNLHQDRNQQAGILQLDTGQDNTPPYQVIPFITYHKT